MNKKKLELPLIEPVLSTYHHQGASAAIALNPSIRNWYLNEKAILKCSHCFLTGLFFKGMVWHKAYEGIY